MPAVEQSVFAINTQQFMMHVFSNASSDQNLYRDFMSLFLSLFKATEGFAIAVHLSCWHMANDVVIQD